jgi:Kdo2-lipid IVA lauroyltransferase/acyltransferase
MSVHDVPTFHPKRFKWRVEWLVQVCLEWVIARLPGAMVFRIGERIGGLLWHLMVQRRRIVLKNLRIAYAGEKGIEELRVLARESFRRSVANLLSAVHTSHMDVAELEASVLLENPELAEEAAAGGKGILFLPPHMGNWEVLSRMNRLYPEGHEAGAFYRPLNNPYLDARLAKKRMSEGMNLFSKRDSLLRVGGFLRKGGLVGVLADQRAGHQGVVTSFFGRLTRATPLPSLLIRRCKCSSLSISLRTVRPGKWSIRYHPVDMKADTEACMEAIERAMRESPVDVFWFQDRWRTYLSRDFTIRDWLGDEARSLRHAHRALVWLAGSASEWKLPEAWEHGDVVYEYVIGQGADLPEWVPEGAVVHRVSDMGKIGEDITRINFAEALPVDYIVTGNSDKRLRRAGKREAIQYIYLP